MRCARITLCFTRRRLPRRVLCGWLALALPAVAQAQAKTQINPNRVPYTEQNGRQIYMDRCAQCHMPDGAGHSDGFNGFPPLKGMSEWLATREGQLYVAHVIIYGPFGGVVVGDQFYYGFMPRFAPRFSDEQIVAVIRYVAEEINTPLPGYQPIDLAIVKEARGLRDHIDAVHAEREQLPPR
jgi:mono/diheme cytochrome c family protein